MDALRWNRLNDLRWLLFVLLRENIIRDLHIIIVSLFLRCLSDSFSWLRGVTIREISVPDTHIALEVNIGQAFILLRLK